jgi:hypothetical protein
MWQNMTMVTEEWLPRFSKVSALLYDANREVWHSFEVTVYYDGEVAHQHEISIACPWARRFYDLGQALAEGEQDDETREILALHAECNLSQPFWEAVLRDIPSAYEALCDLINDVLTRVSDRAPVSAS